MNITYKELRERRTNNLKPPDTICRKYSGTVETLGDFSDGKSKSYLTSESQNTVIFINIRQTSMI